MRFEADVPIAKRGIDWRLLAILAMVASVVSVALNAHLRLIPVMTFAALAVFLVVSTFKMAKKPSKERRRVAGDATGLKVDGGVAMRHAEIATAYRVPTDEGLHAVHLEGRFMRRGCIVYLDTQAEAVALLASLELDASMSRARFRALPPWAKRLRTLAIVLTAMPYVFTNVIRFIPGWGLMILGALYALILLPTILPQRVDIGHDGLFLRWLGNKRFIPFSKIDVVSSTKVGVDLFLRDERHVEIRLTQKDGTADKQVRALLARIEQGLEAHRTLGRADEEAFLARGARDVSTWLADMRALGRGEGGGYRANAIPRERLWAVVENAAADASAREGAALALSTSLDDEERARLRVLALGTASPRVRVALEGVSRERDAERLRVAIETAESEGEALESEAAIPVRRKAAGSGDRD